MQTVTTPRVVIALFLLVLAAVGAGQGVSQGVSRAATGAAPAPSGQLGIKLDISRGWLTEKPKGATSLDTSTPVPAG